MITNGPKNTNLGILSIWQNKKMFYKERKGRVIFRVHILLLGLKGFSFHFHLSKMFCFLGWRKAIDFQKGESLCGPFFVGKRKKSFLNDVIKNFHGRKKGLRN